MLERRGQPMGLYRAARNVVNRASFRDGKSADAQPPQRGQVGPHAQAIAQMGAEIRYAVKLPAPERRAQRRIRPELIRA